MDVDQLTHGGSWPRSLGSALCLRHHRGVHRARLATVVLAAALVVGGAMAVRAQLLRLPSLMGGRQGTGSFLWFDRAFPDLDVEVVASENYTDHRLEVGVLMYFNDQRIGHCYVVPDGLRVAVNGHVLDVEERGHENGRGPRWSLFPCTHACLRSRKGEVIETDRPVTVTIDLGTKHAEMISRTFFQPRRLVLRSGSTARIGGTVIVDRQPPSDDVVESTPTIRLERSTWDSIELWPRDGVTYAAGTWRFALPRLAPGRYKVHASVSGMDLAVIDRCSGVHRCYAQIPSSTYRPAPELDVVE